MKNLAIIPARGGSKRIPRKNIKNFLGKPIIAYSIETALESELFDEVMVSTDDEEIAEVAKDYGAQIPFKRSEKNSTDTAGLIDVLKEVLGYYNKKGFFYDYFCCLMPTAPLVKSIYLKQSFDILEKQETDSIIAVVCHDHPIQRSFVIEDQKLRMKWPKYYSFRSQDLEDTYYDAGMFFCGNVKSFVQKGKVLTNNTSAYILESFEAQDIDTKQDWKLAEIKYEYLKSN